VSIVKHLIQVLFPKYCFGCGKIGGYVCKHCRANLVYISNPTKRTDMYIYELKSVFWYKGVFQKILKGVKYYSVREALEELCESIDKNRMRAMINEWIKKEDSLVLVPVPQHHKRRRERGFNQAYEIALHIARATGLRLCANLVVRHAYSQPQAHVSKDKRNMNIQGAFRVTAASIPAAVIIVDDVWTTGSTMQEIAKCLVEAGVERVYALTLARSF
jgi:competence protein ComFC